MASVIPVLYVKEIIKRRHICNRKIHSFSENITVNRSGMGSVVFVPVVTSTATKDTFKWAGLFVMVN